MISSNHSNHKKSAVPKLCDWQLFRSGRSLMPSAGVQHDADSCWHLLDDVKPLVVAQPVWQLICQWLQAGCCCWQLGIWISVFLLLVHISIVTTVTGSSSSNSRGITVTYRSALTSSVSIYLARDSLLHWLIASFPSAVSMCTKQGWDPVWIFWLVMQSWTKNENQLAQEILNEF